MTIYKMTDLQNELYLQEKNKQEVETLDEIVTEQTNSKKTYSTIPRPLRRTFWISFEQFNVSME